MSDDSSTPPSRPRPRPWLHRLKDFLQAEPQDREQLLDTLREAAERTLIDADTLRMLEGVLSVAELSVRDIMVPRAQMIGLDVDAPLDAVIRKVVQASHSRYPVFGDSRDEVLGILLAKDLLPFWPHPEAATPSPFALRNHLRPVAVVPESKRLDVLLREFRQNRQHMALVIDEFGGVAGLVTIEDILEEIVGEIEDEYDFADADTGVKQIAINDYQVRADLPIADFNAVLAAQLNDDDVDTVGGCVLQALGHMPQRGEHVQIGDLEFTVTAADSRRIRLLRVRRKLAPHPGNGSS